MRRIFSGTRWVNQKSEIQNPKFETKSQMAENGKYENHRRLANVFLPQFGFGSFEDWEFENCFEFRVSKFEITG